MIARAAKVSVMTVSYALRNSPEVSARECRRIQRIADAMQYRPDPLLSHLMQHLRASRTVHSTGNLAVLTDMQAGFVQRMIACAATRAAKLGYTLGRIDPQAFSRKREVLTRTLVARGVSGVLLAPPAVPTDFSGLLDWSRFAAVAMTYSVLGPRLHRVVPHHFDNAVRTFALLRDRGFRRIGLAMAPDVEFRTNHSYTGAFYRFERVTSATPVPILLLQAGDRTGIATWFKRHRPDIIVLANAGQARTYFVPALGEATCRRTSFATLDVEREHPVAGMDQCFEAIGSQAVDLVVAQIHRNERGIPETAVVSMVEGHWIEQPSLYARVRNMASP